MTDLTNEDIEIAGDALAVVSAILDLHDWEALAREAERTESFSAVVDPTWFMHHSVALRNNKRLFSATARYLAELHEIHDEAMADDDEPIPS